MTDGVTTTIPEPGLDRPQEGADGARAADAPADEIICTIPLTKPLVKAKPRVRSRMDRFEAYVSRRMVMGNRLWRRLSSFMWLPIAFKSGIRFKQIDPRTFQAVLPFRRFNRNWYNAMAGAALLANSEIAGGMYIWGVCGGDYTVVCKQLTYKFMRPCFGPALYRVSPREDLDALLAEGGEFNIDVDLDVVQQINPGKGSKERRIGVCHATFHVTPKTHVEAQRKRRKKKRS
ncbi:MAG: hypothetical protein EA379_02635 [Phycisphaerales bacterium]|nr:MAG: hypothetical protein EA379_02635 [Phycisphaerales bacterium]